MVYPKKVDIVEVAPRDGFQSIKEYISPEIKIEVIKKLIDSGFKKIEVTSFVSPKAIPQMRDAKEIVSKILKLYPQRDFIINALVPNLFGAKAAYEAGVDEITYVISTSESHNKANVRRSRIESFEGLKEIKKTLPDLKIKFAVATVFGCPYEGDVKLQEVEWMVKNGLELGVDEICLADTIGVANPLQMREVLTYLGDKFPNQEFSLHLHDTRGMGLANVVVALECGITKFESAAGGLGGCPFAPGAAGNIASEDLINMLESMGIETEIEFSKLMDCVELIKKEIKSDLSSHLAYVDEKCSIGGDNE